MFICDFFYSSEYQKNLGFLKERLPTVYKFLHSEPKEYRVVKGVLGAVTGLALGVGKFKGKNQRATFQYQLIYMSLDISIDIENVSISVQ